MALKVGELFATLNLDDSKLKSGLDGARSALNNAAKDFAKSGAALTAAFTAPLTKLMKESISFGMDFESTMAEVKAISQASDEDFELLKNAAKEMGATTVFSASESAEALKYMAMAGWDTEKMVAGLPGIINLAAASGEDLGEVSDIVTDALTAFGLSADQSSHFADVLAQTSASANTNVHLMGYSFKYAAAIAGSLGYSIEDVGVALGIMANAGIKGEQAGTQLRTIMSNLATGGRNADMALERLGISVTDAEGNMLPFMDVMTQLRKGFGGLTEQEKTMYAEMIGGKEAMAGLLSIVNASDEDFARLVASISNADGAAEKMADTMIDTLSGDITLLKSALEGLGISFYDLFSDKLRSVVQFATAVVGKFMGLSDDTKEMIVRVSALAASLGPLKLLMAGVFKYMSFGVGALQTMLNPLSIAALGLAIFAKNSKSVQRVVKKLKTSFTSFRNWVESGIDPLEAFSRGLKTGFGEQTAAVVLESIEKIQSAFASIMHWFDVVHTGMIRAFKIGNARDGLFGGITNSAKYFINQLRGVWTTLKASVAGWAKKIDWTGVWGGIKSTATTLKDNVKSAFSTAFTKVSDFVSEIQWGDIWSGITTTYETLKDNAKTAFSTAFATVSEFVSGVQWGDIWDGITATYQTLKDKIGAVLGRIPEAINSFFASASDFVKSGKLASVGESIISLLSKGIESKAGGGAATILTAVQIMFDKIDWVNVATTLTGIGDVVITAISKGIESAATGASALLDAVGNLLGSIRWEDVSTTLSGIGDWLIDALSAGIGATLSGANKILDAFNGLLAKIKWDDIGENFADFASNLISAIAEQILSADFSGFVSNFTSAALTAFAGLAELGLQIVAKIVEGIADPDSWRMLWAGLTSLIGSVANGILNAAKTIFDSGWIVNGLLNIGHAILQGLAKTDWGKWLLESIGIDVGEFEVVLANYEIDNSHALTEVEQSIIDDFQALLNSGVTEVDAKDFIVLNTGSGSNPELISQLQEMYQNAFESTETEITPPVEFNVPPVPEGFGQQATAEMQKVLEERGIEYTTPITAAPLDEATKESAANSGKELGGIVSDSMGAGISDGAVNITSAVNEAVSSIKSTLFSQKNSFHATGYQFAAGLASGIRAGKSIITSAAREAARAAVDAANEEIEVSSPSRVMMETGRYFDLGFAKGITRNIRFATGAASQLARQAAGMVSMRSPGAGAHRMISSGTTMSIAAPMDYDAMADALNQRPLYLTQDGRIVASISARNNITAQNSYMRGYALAYGK